MSKQKKYIVVYKITNNINNKEYIGVHRTNKPLDSYMGSGKLILRAIKKHGVKNFSKTILFIFDNDDNGVKNAFQKEAELVTPDYTLREDTYNVSVGGNTNPVMFGKNNPWYGKKMPEHVKNILKNCVRIVSQEQKDKLSENLKKRWEDEDYRNKIINVLKTRILSSESIEKMRQARIGKKLSEETKQKLSNTRKEQFKNEEFKRKFLETVITPERNAKISKKLTGIKKDPEVVNKINRNPEKIRKTAEKHTGMKRSDESRRKMSEAAKNRIPWNKGLTGALEKKRCIHNDDLKKNKMVSLDYELETGWEYGRKKYN